MITMDKKYQTRDGRPVRILCLDRGLRWPVLGLVTDKNGDEHVGTWDVYGLQEFNPNQNLIPVPTRHQAWAWISDDGRVLGFCDRSREHMENHCEFNEHVRLVTWED